MAAITGVTTHKAELLKHEQFERAFYRKVTSTALCVINWIAKALPTGAFSPPMEVEKKLQVLHQKNSEDFQTIRNTPRVIEEAGYITLLS